MADALYTPYKVAMLSTGVNLLTDTIKVQAVDAADYTFLATHQFLSSVLAAGRVGAAVALANKSVAGGVFDADDVVLAGVTGDQFEALILYKDTGVEATSPLIAYIDSATGLPTTPNGADINIIWSNGAYRIFSVGG